eukprot:3297470-Pleurochrysis_carterae.AAC.1
MHRRGRHATGERRRAVQRSVRAAAPGGEAAAHAQRSVEAGHRRDRSRGHRRRPAKGAGGGPRGQSCRGGSPIG